MSNVILLDLDRCVGCGACAVACMDQNDIEPQKGQPAFRRIYQIESGTAEDAAIQYVSAGCNHCEDSPCLTGCPTGAISRDGPGGSVLINRDLCIGCHSCSLACPFGVPRYDRDDKMYKCTLCPERVRLGYKPACVRVCPTEALRYGDPNTLATDKELHYMGGVVRASHRAVVKG